MKAVWIVDGGYLYSYGRSHPFDYLRLKNELENFNGGPIYESYYLNSTRDPVSDSRNAFHDWLKSAPPRGPKMRVQLYRLKELRAECPACSHQYSREVQKGVDVGIATLIVKMAAQGEYDRLILSAGDGDFEDAIAYVKSVLCKEVWLCGSQENLSVDLQSYANQVLWLEDMHPAIGKAA